MRSNRYQIRRVLAVSFIACTAAVAAGCASSGTPGSGPTTTVTVTNPPSSPAPTTPSGPGACSTSDLKLVVGAGNGTAGSIYYPLEFTNVSSAACTVFGYPGVSFVTAAGSQIGAPAGRDGTTPRVLVTVQPGAVAHATLQITEAGNYPPSRCGHIVSVSWLKVYPPNQYSALTVPVTTQGCSSKTLVTMSVSTVSAGS
jgi:Domain of unknown function (DUF4232)